ncbi:hypothetical protein BXZ70DRAFT_536862 [Cristinia sonorae]|uniref:Uncharacterized protein n=1 Tax=Cristinia sonorae TaxID=1940300 RepID=A0A8K0UHC3_9AGAR|nr:hypothetical protein BXZ70DRAFT_536862 [Cristinia sonorae]
MLLMRVSRTTFSTHRVSTFDERSSETEMLHPPYGLSDIVSDSEDSVLARSVGSITAEVDSDTISSPLEGDSLIYPRVDSHGNITSASQTLEPNADDLDRKNQDNDISYSPVIPINPSSSSAPTIPPKLLHYNHCRIGWMLAFVFVIGAYLQLYWISVALYIAGATNTCPAYRDSRVSCLTFEGATQTIALQHNLALPLMKRLSQIGLHATDSPLIIEAAYVNISFGIPALEGGISSDPYTLLDELDSYRRIVSNKWDSVVTIQYLAGDVVSKYHRYSHLLHATADLRQLVIASKTGHRPSKAVSPMRNLEHIVTLDPNVVKITDFVFQSGLLSVIAPHAVVRALSGWKLRPLSEEHTSRWLHVQTDQDTSILVRDSIAAQVNEWRNVETQMAFAGIQLSKSGLNERLRKAFGEEMNRAHHVRHRLKQAIGHNCTSLTDDNELMQLSTQDLEIHKSCVSADRDLQCMEKYVRVLQVAELETRREIAIIDELFRVIATITGLIPSLNSLYVTDTSTAQYLDIPFHDTLEAISYVSEYIKITRQELSAASRVVSNETLHEGHPGIPRRKLKRIISKRIQS